MRDSDHPPRMRPVGPEETLRVRRGVIGIVIRESTLLMIRRAAGVAMGGHWCFPGGHVEPGETPRRAICRELSEELGIEVLPTERIGSLRIGREYILAVWRVRHVRGEFRPAAPEVAEMRWLTPEQARAIEPGLPSNETVLGLLGL